MHPVTPPRIPIIIPTSTYWTLLEPYLNLILAFVVLYQHFMMKKFCRTQLCLLLSYISTYIFSAETMHQGLY